jgi:hypothetical protein
MRSPGSLLACALLSASACSSAGSGSVKDSGGAPSSTASAPAPSGAPAQASAAGSAASSSASSAAPGAATATLAAPSPVALPGGAPGIGFDDLGFSAEIGRVIVPAGRSGNVDLIDPASGAVTSIGGFSTGAKFEGGHDFGVTSACVAGGLLFATDRTSQKLVVADVAARKIVGEAKLAAGPDYVRWVAATSEVWVTEPDADQIEIFSMPAGKTAPVHAATIATKGGPESLVIDAKRGRAYTHLWKGATIAVDLKQRSIAATWPNGCDGSRGIDLDEPNGILFAGCAEGKLVMIDVATGKQLASAQSGSGVDIIAFAPALRHLYFPGGKSKSMAVFGVSAKGDLALLGTVATAEGAHCVAADASGGAYVCDPRGGQLLKVSDPFPASR